MDGTSNVPGHDTNIRRLYEVVSAPRSPRVLCYYDIGVGADMYKVSGAVGGYGFSNNLREAYQFLGENYTPGDEIFIFGYSRGARQAQVLCDLIDQCGIPRLERNPERKQLKVSARTKEIVAVYKGRLRAKDMRSLVSNLGNRKAGIRFVALWDCVESLGSNVGRTALGGDLKQGQFKRHSFYPYDFPDAIREGYHAMALDEQRGFYEVVPWDEPLHLEKGRVLEQIWFPGGHGDVGGGYEKSQGLAGLSLNWIISRLKKTNSLPVDDFVVYESVNGPLTNTNEFLLGGQVLGNFREPYPRSVWFWTHRIPNRYQTRWVTPKIHRSVIERMECGSDRSDKVLLAPDLKREVGQLYRPLQFACWPDTFCRPQREGDGNDCENLEEAINFYFLDETSKERFQNRSFRNRVDWERLLKAVEVVHN